MILVFRDGCWFLLRRKTGQYQFFFCAKGPQRRRWTALKVYARSEVFLYDAEVVPCGGSCRCRGVAVFGSSVLVAVCVLRNAKSL